MQCARLQQGMVAPAKSLAPRWGLPGMRLEVHTVRLPPDVPGKVTQVTEDTLANCQILCRGGARKDCPLEGAGCTEEAAKLRVQVVGQREVQVSCRRCTRVRTAPATLVRMKKDNPTHALTDAAGCKKRRVSTLEQRRGARCLQYELRKALVSRNYHLWSMPFPSGLRVQVSRGDLEGFNNKACNTTGANVNVQ